MRKISLQESSALRAGGKTCLELRVRALGAFYDGNDGRSSRLARRADRRGCDPIKFPPDLDELETYN
uniref:hypothetical protein n=1 Tax=Roseivirga sp. TaxID=1964215 RepID=UPI0040477452